MHSQFIMPSGSVKRKWLDEEDYDTWRQPVLPVVVASPALEKNTVHLRLNADDTWQDCGWSFSKVFCGTSSALVSICFNRRFQSSST